MDLWYERITLTSVSQENLTERCSRPTTITISMIYLIQETDWILDRLAKFTYSEIEHMSYFKTKSFFIISCLKEKQMNRSYSNQLHSISIWILSIKFNGKDILYIWYWSKQWQEDWEIIIFCWFLFFFSFPTITSSDVLIDESTRWRSNKRLYVRTRRQNKPNFLMGPF
jgi:hypothetical protein